MNPNLQLNALNALVCERRAGLAAMSVTAGFDGFIDEMISVVAERQGLEEWKPVPDIDAFGDWVKGAAGRSSLREIIVHRVDPGGCAVNLGDALISLGIQLDCFATLGQPRHPAFDAFAQQCRICRSWSREPGRTLAFEFSDGKLMFSAVTQLAEFNCRLLDTVLADGDYLRACQQARLIALTDWTLYPHMTECWQKLQAEVYAQLRQRPYFFIDLVDPTSRSPSDIRAMLGLLAGFENSGETILGLNGNEANVLAGILSLPQVQEETAALQQQAHDLRNHLGIHQVVIHGVKVAVVADAQGACSVPGPYCAHPKKSTGAGDRFNAGYCAGLMLGLANEHCLQLGSACSGFFVRHARSASIDELSQFIQAWGQEKLGD